VLKFLNLVLNSKFVFWIWCWTLNFWISKLLRLKGLKKFWNWFSWDCFCWLISGLEILAFPCNQFLNQEPGNSQEAEQFACTRFKAEYPIFGKVMCCLFVYRVSFLYLIIFLSWMFLSLLLNDWNSKWIKRKEYNDFLV